MSTARVRVQQQLLKYAKPSGQNVVRIYYWQLHLHQHKVPATTILRSFVPLINLNQSITVIDQSPSSSLHFLYDTDTINDEYEYSLAIWMPIWITIRIWAVMLMLTTESCDSNPEARATTKMIGRSNSLHHHSFTDLNINDNITVKYSLQNDRLDLSATSTAASKSVSSTVKWR